MLILLSFNIFSISFSVSTTFTRHIGFSIEYIEKDSLGTPRHIKPHPILAAPLAANLEAPVIFSPQIIKANPLVYL